MIIDSNNVNSSTTAGTRTRSTAETGNNSKAAAANKPAETEKDSVSLSSKAQTMGRLEAKMADTPEVDEAKVAAIKAAISEGRYQVDSQTVAERMLAQDSWLG